MNEWETDRFENYRQQEAANSAAFCKCRAHPFCRAAFQSARASARSCKCHVVNLVFNYHCYNSLGVGWQRKPVSLGGPRSWAGLKSIPGAPPIPMNRQYVKGE
eukprot:scaffold9199_cov41-Prasinocladus_malaysianus.AAC.1